MRSAWRGVRDDRWSGGRPAPGSARSLGLFLTICIKALQLFVLSA
jgi:hypothetical protein